jgi:hypothetical protein
LLSDPEQGMFDVIVEREQRRERKGYLSPAQARAFLQEARQRDLSSAVPPASGAVARAYFAGIEPPPLEDSQPSGTRSPAPDSPAVTGTAIDPVTELLDVLRDAGVVPQPPRALLESPDRADDRLALLHAYMRAVYECDYATYLKRGEELAYLANVVVAACPLQGRAMTPQEASDAVAATCNLGLENFPPQWVSGDSFGGPKDRLRHELPLNHDLIRIFEVGWAVLHRDVCVYAAGQLLNVLRQLRVADAETQASLDTLRIGLRRHGDNGKPWLVRDDLDVIALLDLPAWAALLGLIDQCPSIHAAIVSARDRRVRSVSASFEFIAVNSQIDTVRDYLGSLLQRMSP